MSNASVINRIRQLLDQYQIGEGTAETLERDFEFHLNALEFTELEQIHHARNLCSVFVHTHFWDGGEEFGNLEEARKVLSELYQFLDELPVVPQ